MGGFEHVFVFDSTFAKSFLQKPEDHVSQIEAVTRNGTFLPLMGEHLAITARAQESMKALFKRSLKPLALMCTVDFGSALQIILSKERDAGSWKSREFFTDLMIRLIANMIVGEEMNGDERQQLGEIALSLRRLVGEAERTQSFGWAFVFWKSRSVHGDLRRLLTPIIQERRQWQREDPDNWLKQRGRRDLVSLAVHQVKINEERGMDEDEANKMIPVVIGNLLFGTIANSPIVLEHLVASILQNRKLYNDVREEIDTVCEEHSPKSPWDIPASEFPLLSACLMEEMRMNPNLTISRTIRKTSLQLPHEFEAAPGTTVHVIPRFVHEDAIPREDPNCFDPYRMREDGMRRISKGAPFLGWGHGQHFCPGSNLAKQLIKVTIIALMRSYDMELEHSVTDSTCLSHSPPLPRVRYEGRDTPRMQTSVSIKYKRRCTPNTES